MKNIKFTKLEIKNFRNINELSIDFNENVTEILASNGKGKTNTLSAIMWCIFGKDINDNKSFTISPIIDGIEDNSINTVVKLIINGNYIIERSYFKRVTSLKTGYIIDEKEQLVSSTQTQFKQELLDNFVDEETFKSLSNINYIPNLHWKELKKLIFDLIGDIKDEEILLRGDFSRIEEYITRFGIDQTQKLLSETDKELNDDIKRLETEYQTLINTKEKYVSNEEDNSLLEKRKLEIENELYSTQNKQQEFMKQKQEYDLKKQNLYETQNKITKIENEISYNKSNIKEYKELYSKNGFDVELLRKSELDRVNYKLQLNENSINRIEQDILRKKETIELLKNEGKLASQKEIKVENDTCNACGQHLPNEIINSTLEKLKENHNNYLQDIKNKLEKEKFNLKGLEDEFKKLKLERLSLEKEFEEIKVKEYANTSDETEKQKQLRNAYETKEIDNELHKKNLIVLKEEFEKLNKDFSILDTPVFVENDNLPLRLELQEINNKLATTITLNKISEDIESSLKNLNNKKENKIIIKEKIQDAIKFNNIKADLLKEKVRNYFKEVNFITKEFTIDGTEQETFKIANDKGIEWKDINTGHKILLGVDLLQGIMKAKEIFVPVIIDNCENVTNEIVTENTQLIIAKAVKGIDKIEIK